LLLGDAYIDHPSFGPVLIARYLESHGFSVGIIAQPDWKKNADFQKTRATSSFLWHIFREPRFYGG